MSKIQRASINATTFECFVKIVKDAIDKDIATEAIMDNTLEQMLLFIDDGNKVVIPSEVASFLGEYRTKEFTKKHPEEVNTSGYTASSILQAKRLVNIGKNGGDIASITDYIIYCSSVCTLLGQELEKHAIETRAYDIENILPNKNPLHENEIALQEGCDKLLAEELEDKLNILKPHEQPTSSVIMEAHKIITTRGQDDYGDAERCMSKIGKQWYVYLYQKYGIHCAITAEDVCYMMADLKKVRQMHKPKRDNIVDGIGYLALVAECNEPDRCMPQTSNKE